MDREVIWTGPAASDLEAIAEYIAKDSEYYARSFVQQVIASVESLRSLGDRGQRVPEYGDDTVREILVAPYRIVYELSTTSVTILSIIHGARRLNRYE